MDITIIFNFLSLLFIIKKIYFLLNSTIFRINAGTHIAIL